MIVGKKNEPWISHALIAQSCVHILHSEIFDTYCSMLVVLAVTGSAHVSLTAKGSFNSLLGIRMGVLTYLEFIEPRTFLPIPLPSSQLLQAPIQNLEQVLTPSLFLVISCSHLLRCSAYLVVVFY